ncbi:MAG: ABC transporter permease [Flavobacteriales bacterium]|jgi:phospholipid/cholesterol/gamma-HCH transport system permease protein|nr:ABC transporter permease [Flavobacteriales bacterium]
MFTRPEKLSVYWNRTLDEIIQLGIKSLGLVVVMSFFMGSVLVIQTATAIDSPLIPRYTVGFTLKQSMILEFSSTIISLILAGKIGSNIASELGTMRVSEQIDALDIMGVNSAGYLIAPKIFGAMFVFPIIVVFSMVFGFIGGGFIASTTDLVTLEDYLFGIRSFSEGNDFMLFYTLFKSIVFAFLMTSISSYFGYHARGGALEVGRASTDAVVYSSIFILFSNVLITQLLLI